MENLYNNLELGGRYCAIQIRPSCTLVVYLNFATSLSKFGMINNIPTMIFPYTILHWESIEIVRKKLPKLNGFP